MMSRFLALPGRTFSNAENKGDVDDHHCQRNLGVDENIHAGSSPGGLTAFITVEQQNRHITVTHRGPAPGSLPTAH